MGPRRVGVNVTQLYKWAWSLLRRSPYIVWPKDKEGGFALVGSLAAKQLSINILNSHVYTTNMYACNTVLVRKKVYTIAARIAKAEGDGTNDNVALKDDILKPWHRLGTNLCAVLRPQLKTHKEARNVKLRAVHALSAWKLEGFSKYVASKLAPKLAELTYVIKDTKDAVRRCKALRPAASWRFARVDIKDFFYSGSAAELIEDGCAFGDIDPTGPAADALELLLSTQMARLSSDTEARARVVCGSGMGLPHSGDLLDACFAVRGDAFARGTRLSTFYGIQTYWRFKDDILIVYDTDAVGDINRFLNQWSHVIKYFTLKVEEINVTQVEFLELRIAIQGERMVTSYKLRGNAGAPLGASSGHHPSVARWPLAMCKRISTFCARREDAKAVCAKCKARFASFGVPWPDQTKSIAKRNSFGTVMWIPMGFHPSIRSILSRSLARFLEDYTCLTKSLFMRGAVKTRADTFRFAWKSMLPPMFVRYRGLEQKS